jgi:hypothetical protein
LCGLEVALERVLEALCAELPVRFEQAARRDPRLARDWLAATGLEGCAVELESAGARHTGRLVAFDLDALDLGGTRFALEHVQSLARA